MAPDWAAAEGASIALAAMVLPRARTQRAAARRASAGDTQRHSCSRKGGSGILGPVTHPFFVKASPAYRIGFVTISGARAGAVGLPGSRRRANEATHCELLVSRSANPAVDRMRGRPQSLRRRSMTAA